VPAIYPTLIGLTFTVIKRPKFSTEISSHVSGREARVGYYANPLWEFELSYDFIPDAHPNLPGSFTSDLKQLMGFFLAHQGQLIPFCFKDPDDNTVTAQPIGTGDGTTSSFTLVRTFGGSDGTSTEPIGYADLSQTFNVYLSGVLQSPSSYTVNQTIMGQQTLNFLTSPASGKAVAVDMSYYYAVRFGEDTNDFEKFAYKLWQLKKVLLQSIRSENAPS